MIRYFIDGKPDTMQSTC